MTLRLTFGMAIRVLQQKKRYRLEGERLINFLTESLEEIRQVWRLLPVRARKISRPARSRNLLSRNR